MTATLVGPGPVVLVDDDFADTQILTRCFRRATLSQTYELISFSDGETFLDHMAEVIAEVEPMPSVVLLDINMPSMSGFEVLDRMRSQPSFAEVPAVVFVSNSDNPDDATRAGQLGARFVEKFENVTTGVAFFDGLI